MKYLKNIIKNIIYLLKHDIKLVIRVNRQTNKINELESLINSNIGIFNTRIKELEKKLNRYITSDSINALKDFLSDKESNKRVTNKGI